VAAAPIEHFVRGNGRGGSMASMCHRSGRTQDDLEPAARCAVAVPSILLDDLRRLGMEARPR
jgi:hypothetical protein